MNEEYKSAYNDMIEEYTQLSLKEKQTILLDEFKELVAIVDLLCKQEGIDSQLLLNRELLDIKKEDASSDDYIEAAYVYLTSLKESLGRLLSKYTD